MPICTCKDNEYRVHYKRKNIFYDVMIGISP